MTGVFRKSLIVYCIVFTHSLAFANPPSQALQKESKYLGNFFGPSAPSLKLVIPASKELKNYPNLDRNFAYVSIENFEYWFGQKAESGYLRLYNEYKSKNAEFAYDISQAQGVILVRPHAHVQDNKVLVLNHSLANMLQSIEKPSKDALSFVPVSEELQEATFVDFGVAAEFKESQELNFHFELQADDIRNEIRSMFLYLPLSPSLGTKVELVLSGKKLGLPNVRALRITLKKGVGHTKYLGNATRIKIVSNDFRITLVEPSLYSTLTKMEKNRSIEKFISNLTPFVQPLPAIEPLPQALEAIDESKTQITQLNLDFKSLGIGGLDSQMHEIIRAVLSRAVPDEALRKLGMKGHERGILLYGPPGTGKTLIARELASMLGVSDDRFKVVNGPELLNSYLGKSEENIRNLFNDAKWNPKHLHVIFFDEFDSIASIRSNGGETGDKVGNRIVNQLLTMMDGATPIPNVLLIAATNRKDIIDPALLRPGRFGVHLMIGLPDDNGRKQIFNIHLKQAIENNALASNVSIETLVKRSANFSGAEIQGLCNMARSHALEEAIDLKNPAQVNAETFSKVDVAKLTMSMEHFDRAFNKISPTFGHHGSSLEKQLPIRTFNLNSQETMVNKILYKAASPQAGRVSSFMITGETKSGKSAVAGLIADASQNQFDFTRVISPSHSKRPFVEELERAWHDAQSVKNALIVLDGLEHSTKILNVNHYDARALSILNSIFNAPIENHIVIVATMETEAFSIFKRINQTATWSAIHRTSGLATEDLTTLFDIFEIKKTSSLTKLLIDATVGTTLEIIRVENAKNFTEYQWEERIELLSNS